MILEGLTLGMLPVSTATGQQTAKRKLRWRNMQVTNMTDSDINPTRKREPYAVDTTEVGLWSKIWRFATYNGNAEATRVFSGVGV